MAPGREELKEDRPTIGGSGKLLWSMAARRGKFYRHDCAILNTIGEWPEGNGGARPSQEQLDRWWDRFNEAIKSTNAEIIILLGGDAMERVMGFRGIEKWRGYLMKPEDREHLTRTVMVQGEYKTSNKAKGIKKGDPKWEKVKEKELCPLPSTVRYIIPTLHPAAVLRSGFGSLPAFAADIARAGRALRGELKPYRTEFSQLPAMTWKEAPCGPGDPLAFDIETPRDQGHRRVIDRIAVAGPNSTWSAPWDMQAKESAKASLAEAGVRIAHNIAFDAPHLEAHGVAVPEPWFDTMLGAAMLEPDLYKGLNPVASLYLDRPRWKHLSEEDPALYNATDASATLELYYAEKAVMEKQGQYEVFTKTIMPVIPVLIDMTQKGIPLDQARRAAWVEQLTREKNEAFRKWYDLAGDINPSSPKQLSEFMYGKLKLPEQFNKYGGITSDAASIKTLITDPRNESAIPVLKSLLEYRTASKLLETYAEVPTSDDGCVHPSWLPASKDDDGFGRGLAGTWRITSHGPNFQNQPPSARKLYIPPKGYCFIEADWSQIEARIIAALSGDRALAEAISRGLHRANMEMLGVDKTRAKNAFYGWCYGAGKRTLRRTFLQYGFDIPEAECAALLRRFDLAFPDVHKWRKGIQHEISTTYSLRNPFGLRRHFYRGGEDTPAAYDYLPQSSAAMCMWSVARPLRDDLRKLDGGVYALVHDSILIAVPVSERERGVQCLQAHMERNFECIAPGFHVPVEVKLGDEGVAWGDLTAVA